MLKRFVVFTGYKDQCQGGLESIDSHFDTLEEAIARGIELTGHRQEWDDENYDGDYSENEDDENYDEDDYDGSLWLQIADTEIMEVVKEMGREAP